MATYEDLTKKIIEKYPNLKGSVTNPGSHHGKFYSEVYVNFSLYSDNKELLASTSYTIKGMPTGCGSLIFSQWTAINYIYNYISQKDWNIIVLDIFTIIKEVFYTGGPGVFIATAGDSCLSYYRKAYDFLLEDLNFKIVDQYHNYTDGPNYMQRLLTYHL